MSTNANTPVSSAWSPSQKVFFRFFFLYFLLQSLPLDIEYLKYFFSFQWIHLKYWDFFNLSRFMPHFLPGNDSFWNWLIVALLALSGAIMWTIKSRNAVSYDRLYYWLRVLVRYRLAIAVIAFAMIKIFPMQSPYPSISNLNTHYGFFTRWKLFTMSLGIVPGYEAFLGWVELTAGLLLLYRKTASVAAFILIFFTGNVFMSNLAYEGGEAVYSLYLISFALFIFAYDAVRLYQLFASEKGAQPNRFRLALHRKWSRARVLLKMAFFFFVILYGFKTAAGYRNNPYQYPVAKGLSGTSGLYNVQEFRINGKTLPYSEVDPVRWKDVVFEKWATISIRSNRPVLLDLANNEVMHVRDEDRDYEVEGSGERQYYSYTTDVLNQNLLLHNKNRNYAGEQLVLHYDRPDSNHIILSGLNEHRDSVYVVLAKLPKKYLLQEAEHTGRRQSLKL